MAMYEPIKSYDEGDFKRSKSLRVDGNGAGACEEEDVESGRGSSFSQTIWPVGKADGDIQGKRTTEEKKSLIPSADSEHHHRQQQQPKQQHHRQKPQQGRLVSLDVFRGLTVVLMILVDYGGGILPAINHSPWDGLTLADLVMPFFLFIVGVSLALTYKKFSSKGVATRKAILRTLKLLLLGLFLQGGFFHGVNDLTYGMDIEQIRWMGILQRISIAYFIGAMCEIWLKGDDHVSSGSSLVKNYKFQWTAVLVLIGTYLSLSYGLYVPDWQYQIPVEASSSNPKIFTVKCGVRGDTGPACNAAGMIDRSLLGIQHLYRKPVYARTEHCSINSPSNGPLPPDAPSWCQAPFDPEGILSSVMAIITCLVGLHYGHIIVHLKEHKDRIFQWMMSSTCLIFWGIMLDFFGMHVNKALYTFSFMCVTAGAAGILLAGIYVLVDLCGYKQITLVFEWVGMHALMIYILAACNLVPVFLQGFYWRQPQNNILTLIGIGR